jgi:hypothetical protein
LEGRIYNQKYQAFLSSEKERNTVLLSLEEDRVFERNLLLNLVERMVGGEKVEGDMNINRPSIKKLAKSSTKLKNL